MPYSVKFIIRGREAIGDIDFELLVAEGGSFGLTKHDTKIRRERSQNGDLAAWAYLVSEQKSAGSTSLTQLLHHAMEKELTETQRNYLELHYVNKLNCREIARLCGVHPSTVSRTLRRGETRIKRCLKYGAGELLRSLAVKE